MSRAEVRALMDGEKRCQEHLDRFYRSRGWTPDRSRAGKGFDVLLSVRGAEVKVEEKTVSAGWKSAFLVEIEQDLWSRDSGWYHYTRCDRLFWVPRDRAYKPTCLYSVKWRPFKRWLPDWIRSKPRRREFWDWHECADGYGYTLNIRVPWGRLPANMYEIFEHVDELPF